MAQASSKKLQHIGPAEKERVTSAQQSEQLARTPGMQRPGKTESVNKKIHARAKKMREHETAYFVRASGSEREKFYDNCRNSVKKKEDQKRIETFQGTWPV